MGGHSLRLMLVCGNLLSMKALLDIIKLTILFSSPKVTSFNLKSKIYGTYLNRKKGFDNLSLKTLRLGVCPFNIWK